MDELKKYIREHRDELDVEMPPPSHIWQNKTATKQPLTTIVIKWLAAASVILILSTAIYWGMSTSRHKSWPQAEVIKKDSNKILQRHADSLNDSVPQQVKNIAGKNSNDLASREEEQKKGLAIRPRVSVQTRSKNKLTHSASKSLEANYASIISYQLKRLERTPIYIESADYFHVFKKQWYDMEKDEEKIKEDLDTYGLSDMLVDQFIQLYQQKIGLLKQLQTEIDKMNIRARNNPEFRKQTPTYLKM
jgi:hypothetical protein